MIPPESPPFDPLPTPLLPPVLSPISAINTSISTLTSASTSAPSPKKSIKSNTNASSKDVKEKDLNYTKEKDKDNIKERESDTNEKERKDFNGDEIYGKDASSITKELMTRQDKITEAFHLRAAAITSSSTSSSATSSASLSTAASLSATSASLSATATSMVIPLGMESDGSGVSIPTKSNIGSRSPNLGPASNTSKLSNASNVSSVPNITEGEVEFKEVRKMPVLVKETSPTSMSPVNTVSTVKMHGVISANSLGPMMMDSAMQLTSNGKDILCFDNIIDHIAQ